MNDLIFITGEKSKDFVLFYLEEEVEIGDDDITFFHEEFNAPEDLLETFRSNTWSANCRFFFVVTKERIMLGNTFDNHVFVANTTMKFINLFLNAKRK